MAKIKKILGIALLMSFGVVYVSLYRNIHLLNKTRTIGNNNEKIQTLEHANRIFPYNHKIYHELGRTYFELASLDLQNIEQRDANFEKSIQSFVRAIKLNPGYYQSHFYFAQALSYQQYFAPIEVNFYDEYKKAARLTTFDSHAYFEVGRFLFTHWLELSKEDKQYTLGLLKNINTNRENLQTILQIWAINGGDFAVIEDILPEESGVYRTFAQFLADKKLSINERHKKLSQAEYLDFKSALKSFSEGERQARSRNVDRAIGAYRESLKTTENIRFYQNLTDQTLINSAEFTDTQKALYLNLVKNQIIKSGELEDAEIYLRKYLDLENNSAEIGELENFLNERNALKAEPGTDFINLFPFYVKVSLDYKMNRFRDIIEWGKDFKESILRPPETLKMDLARICQLIGSSYQMLDFLYDAEVFFNLAMNLDPTHLETLKGLHQNYIKLNKPEMAKKIVDRIKSMQTPEEINFKNLVIQRDQNFKQTYVLEEKKIGFILTLAEVIPGQPPLVAVEFNGQIIWEDYIKTQDLFLPVNAEEGTNELVIRPLLTNVYLQKIVYTDDNQIIKGMERDTQTHDESSQPAQRTQQSPSLSFILDTEIVDGQDSLNVEIVTDPFLTFSTFKMSNPERIILDLSGIDDIKSGRRIEVNKDPVREMRLGMFKSDTARIVFSVNLGSPHYQVERTPRGIKIIFAKK